MRPVVFYPLLVATAACGLTLTGVGVESDPPNGGPDAGSETDAARDDGATSVDASTDAPVIEASADSGVCTVLIDDTFDTVDPRWEKLGAASFESGQVRLTARDNSSEAGAIWWKTELSFTGTLHVLLELAIDSQGVTSGDGIGFGWVTTPYKLAGEGQSFGLCSGAMDGTGIVADTRDSQLLLMGGVAEACQTNGGVFNGTFAADMQLVAEVRATGLSATLNGITGARQRPTAKTSWFGVVASTGNGESGHFVQRVKVTSCP